MNKFEDFVHKFSFYFYEWGLFVDFMPGYGILVRVLNVFFLNEFFDFMGL